MAMTLDNPSFTQATDRGPSPNLWYSFPAISALRDNPTLGWFIDDDFTDIPFTSPTTEANFGRYKAFGSSGTTFTQDTSGVIADRRGGALMITQATSDLSGCVASVALPFQIINTSGKIAFEARIRTSATGTLCANTLIGLMDARTLIVGDPLTTAGALISTLNFVGFQRLEATGTLLQATFQKSGQTQNVSVTSAATTVADTWVKVGFRYDPIDGILRWFVNGVENATTVSKTVCDGATFPSTVMLGLVFAHMAGATTAATQAIDWWRCIQVPNDNIT